MIMMNLESVLNKLPKQVRFSGECIAVLEIDFLSNTVYYFNGLAAGDRMDNKLSPQFDFSDGKLGYNLALLLEWGITHYPKEFSRE